MSVSVILRLVPERLAEGVIAGQVEVVHSGECALVHDADELTRFLVARLVPGTERT